MNVWRLTLGLVIVVAGLVAILGMLLAFPKLPAPQIQGVSFSQPHASGIGLDWQQTYLAILEDLGVRHLRLSVYWNVVEPADDNFDFSVTDYQMDLAAKYGAKVVLGIGRKLPRWPECHVPAWAAGLSEAQQQEQVLSMLPVIINRYKNHPALQMWQLENEPLLDFGICPPEDRQFLAREEQLLRSLDGGHPILITDSGELNSWLGAASFGDVLGTTMYRTVFSERTQRHFYYDYIFPAWGYRVKARYVQLLRGKDVLISELQGEPWGALPFPQMTVAQRQEAFSRDRFVQLARFAGRTQLPAAYWWGVEYWYWEKVAHGNDSYWEFAKTLFKTDK